MGLRPSVHFGTLVRRSLSRAEARLLQPFPAPPDLKDGKVITSLLLDFFIGFIRGLNFPDLKVGVTAIRSIPTLVRKSLSGAEAWLLQPFPARPALKDGVIQFY
jgi:hypothetical protein